MQADYAGANEVKLSLRSSDHGGLIADTTRLKLTGASLAVLLRSFVLSEESRADEFMEENPQQFRRCRGELG
jgi:hypothetical protein